MQGDRAQHVGIYLAVKMQGQRNVGLVLLWSALGILQLFTGRSCKPWGGGFEVKWLEGVTKFAQCGRGCRATECHL